MNTNLDLMTHEIDVWLGVPQPDGRTGEIPWAEFDLSQCHAPRAERALAGRDRPSKSYELPDTARGLRRMYPRRHPAAFRYPRARHQTGPST